jgi:hypothetical protein
MSPVLMSSPYSPMLAIVQFVELIGLAGTSTGRS